MVNIYYWEISIASGKFFTEFLNLQDSKELSRHVDYTALNSKRKILKKKHYSDNSGIELDANPISLSHNNNNNYLSVTK